MHRMRVAVVLCAAAGALILPARAAALVYPVSDSDGLTAALATAAGTAASDTIELAAGLYPGSFSYGAASPIEIVGAGPALTTIQTNASYAGISLDNGSAANSRIANLGVEITGGTTVRAINVGGTGATVEDVALTTSGGSNLFGIELNASGATIRRVTSSGAFSRVISSYAGSSSISDVKLTGNGSGSGIEADAASSNVVVRHARLSQFGTAAAAKFSGTLVITDSLIDLRGLSSAAALVVGDNNNNSANTSTLTADRLTIAGDAGATAVDVAAGSVNEPDVMTATLRDSIVSGFDEPLECSEAATVPTGVINVSKTAMTGTVSNGCADGDPDPGVTTTAITEADPKFVNAPAGDFRLRWDSPLLDLAAQAPDPGLTDLLDKARVVDGNGDGTATADLGAYEYQRTAPVIGTAAYSRGVTPPNGDPYTFVGSATDPDPLEEALLTFAWAFDDGGAASGAVVEHAFVVPGVHHATLTVTDPAGAIAQTVVAVTVPVLDGGPGVKGPPPQVIPDTNAPTISKLSLSKRITRAANRPKLVVRKRAQLRLTLSEAAMLKLTFAKANGRGFKPVPGSVTLKARAGAIGILLRGQLSARRRLAAGTYRITVVATDAAGNRSAPARATFTLIVPAAHPRRGAGAPVVFARL